ncbi:hypothetical protein HDU96_010546 [Phlyctochytrium bullatum]|nr:hypothetical protein HDU96_010546 [Phlyctochytrium bullatum]
MSRGRGRGGGGGRGRGGRGGSSTFRGRGRGGAPSKPRVPRSDPTDSDEPKGATPPPAKKKRREKPEVVEDDGEGPSMTLTLAVLASRWTQGGVGGTNGPADRPRKKTAEGDKEAPPPPPPTLQDAEAADCSRLKIDAIEDLSPAVSLQRLNLEGNRLAGEDALEGLAHCKSLTWLNLAHNKIESLKHLQGMEKLQGEDLNVTWESRGAISPSKANRCFSLKIVLNLSFNEITRISDHAKKLKSLKALILNNNQITRIDNISTLTQLTTLVLSHNNITEIPPMPTLTKLTKISLSHNYLRAFPDLSSIGPSLKELRLAHNRLLRLDADRLRLLPRLEILDVAANLIADLQTGVIQPLTDAAVYLHLRNLNLKGNPVAQTASTTAAEEDTPNPPAPSSDAEDAAQPAPDAETPNPYREAVVEAVPGLLVFDNVRIDPRYRERVARRKEREQRERAAERKAAAAKSKKTRPAAQPSDGEASDAAATSDDAPAAATRKRAAPGAGAPPGKRARTADGTTAAVAIPLTPGGKPKAVAPGQDELDPAVDVRGSVLRGRGPRPPERLDGDDDDADEEAEDEDDDGRTRQPATRGRGGAAARGRGRGGAAGAAGTGREAKSPAAKKEKRDPFFAASGDDNASATERGGASRGARGGRGRGSERGRGGAATQDGRGHGDRAVANGGRKEASPQKPVGKKTRLDELEDEPSVPTPAAASSPAESPAADLSKLRKPRTKKARAAGSTMFGLLEDDGDDAPAAAVSGKRRRSVDDDAEDTITVDRQQLSGVVGVFDASAAAGEKGKGKKAAGGLDLGFLEEKKTPFGGAGLGSGLAPAWD